MYTVRCDHISISAPSSHVSVSFNLFFVSSCHVLAHIQMTRISHLTAMTAVAMMAEAATPGCLGGPSSLASLYVYKQSADL